MRTIVFLIPLLLVIGTAYADCASGVTVQISSNGKLSESDRPRLLKECEDFNAFRQSINTDPSDAYILDMGNFACLERNDYVTAFNFILEHGGSYLSSDIRKFGACTFIQRQTLVKLVAEKADDPIVQIRFANSRVPDCIYNMWIHKGVLKPYGDLLKLRVK